METKEEIAQEKAFEVEYEARQLAAKKEEVEKCKAEILESIETLKTVVSFINTTNIWALDKREKADGSKEYKATQLIDCVNRFLKADFDVTEKALNNEDTTTGRSFHKDSALDIIKVVSELS